MWEYHKLGTEATCGHTTLETAGDTEEIMYHHGTLDPTDYHVEDVLLCIVAARRSLTELSRSRERLPGRDGW